MLNGLILHIFSKFLFIICSYGIHIFIGKYLGLENYGLYGIIITILNMNYMFLNNGVRQAASIRISQNKFSKKSIVKKSIMLQLWISLILAALNIISSSSICKILNDNSLGYYINVSALIIPFTGLFFAYTGVLNGNKAFAKETRLMNIYTILRFLGVVIVLFIFKNGIDGVVVGFFAASFISAIVGWLMTKTEKDNEDKDRISITYKEIWMVAYPTLIFFAGTNLLMNIDTLAVKKILVDNSIVGLYTSAVNIGKVPYYLAYSFTAVLLPYVSQAYISNEIENARSTIQKILSLVAFITIPIVVFGCYTSRMILTILYSPEYIGASVPLAILLCSMVFMVVTVILNSILNGIDKNKISIYIIILTVIIDIILLKLMTFRFGIVGSAISNLVSLFLGMIFSGYYVNKYIKNCFNWKKVANILALAAGLTVFCYLLTGLITPDSFVRLMLYYSICSIFYMLLAIKLDVINIDKVGFLKNIKRFVK